MYPEGQRDLPAERPPGGFEEPPTPERPRAVIFEPHPAVRVVLEYLLARLYASSDVFVFPSTTDTLGRAVAEAQASGLPAVVCGIGGPRECIRPGVSGLVAGVGDEEAFFSKIELLIEDPRLRERMGLAAREFAGGMSWEAVLDDLVDLHSRLAGVRTTGAALGS